MNTHDSVSIESKVNAIYMLIPFLFIILFLILIIFYIFILFLMFYYILFIYGSMTTCLQIRIILCVILY